MFTIINWKFVALFFAIFINDLPDNMRSECKMFAEDTKILGNIRLKFAEEDSRTVQQDLNII